MALKRLTTDTDRSASPKRARKSLSAEACSDSSAMSPCAVSKSSTVDSSSEAVVRAHDSSSSSVPSQGSENDPDSSPESSDNSESSEVEEDEDEDADNNGPLAADHVVTLGGPKKPTISAGGLSGANDLTSRLKAFLPQMQQANSDLARSGTALNMEDVGDDEDHIEMSLGLGVLEQKEAEKPEILLKRSSQSAPDEDAGSFTSDTSTNEPDVLESLLNMQREVTRSGQPSIKEIESRTNRGAMSTGTFSEEPSA